jgi:hypothetical protein
MAFHSLGYDGVMSKWAAPRLVLGNQTNSGAMDL